MSNGKGSGRRKETKPGAYAAGWDALWGNKEGGEKKRRLKEVQHGIECLVCDSEVYYIDESEPDIDWAMCARCGAEYGE